MEGIARAAASQGLGRVRLVHRESICAMFRQKTFVKVSGRGAVNKVVKEHYLRDDIPCGVVGCSECTPLMEAAVAAGLPASFVDPCAQGGVNAAIGRCHVILPDTNILLHHLDVLETAHFTDIILLQTVLDEVKANSLAIHKRLQSLLAQRHRRFFAFSNEHHRGAFLDDASFSGSAGAATALPKESPNDRNDRAIRRAATWYAAHLAGQQNASLHTAAVALVTNDAANAAAATREGSAVVVLSLRQLCEGFLTAEGGANDALLDMLESARSSEAAFGERDSPPSFEEHWSLSRMRAAVKGTTTAYQGTLQIDTYNSSIGRITATVNGVAGRVICITSKEHLNRAMQGDTVVVQLLACASAADDDAAMPLSPEDGADTTTTLDEAEASPLALEAATLGVESGKVLVDDSLVEEVSPEEAVLGKVVGILRRSMRPICGSIDRKTIRADAAMQSVLVAPLDRRLPRIRMRTRNAASMASQRLVVCIDGWEASSRYPHGHLVRVLGAAGERAVETEVILLEHDVAHADFTPAVLACLPSEAWMPTPADYAERADFRSLDVCSVDPPGCTDIDDALHAVALPNGNVQVGVHIADVTHFVQANSAIDAEAASRGTTVYLVDKRIDMLPSLLGTNLCSLQCNVERLAVSVTWEICPADASIISTAFARSVIKSRASFTYDQAQQILDASSSRAAQGGEPAKEEEARQGKEDCIKSDEERTRAQLNARLAPSLTILNELARKLKAKRIAAGALTLSSSEIRFELDEETKAPTDVYCKEMKEANSLVEEFMLLANISVARHLHERFAQTAVLRRHPSPPAENFAALNRALASRGFSLEVSSSRALADSLDAIVVPGDDYFNRLVRIMTTRCMYQAQYFAAGSMSPDAFWHYGLATAIYTHFTSPIRRYADVLVHRLLTATLSPPPPALSSEEGSSAPASAASQTAAPLSVASSIATWDLNRLDDICSNLNYRNRMAQQAQRSSTELFTHLFFKGKCTVEDAYVLKVVTGGVVVLIPRFGIEGLVKWSDDELASAGIHLDTSSGRFMRSTGSQGGNVGDGDNVSDGGDGGNVSQVFLELFQKVSISMSVVESDASQRQQMVITLIHPSLAGTPRRDEERNDREMMILERQPSPAGGSRPALVLNDATSGNDRATPCGGYEAKCMRFE